MAAARTGFAVAAVLRWWLRAMSVSFRVGFDAYGATVGGRRKWNGGQDRKARRTVPVCLPPTRGSTATDA